jgi:hypothetical protein
MVIEKIREITVNDQVNSPHIALTMDGNLFSMSYENAYFNEKKIKHKEMNTILQSNK